MEANSAPAESANNQQSAPAQKGNEGEVTQNVLTPEAVRQMIEESNRPLHAEIRRLREGAKPKQSEPSEAERTLSQRIQAMEADKAEVEKDRKIGQLRAAALKEGVPEDRVDIFVDHILSRKGGEIVSSRSGAEWDQYNDAQSRKPINELIKSMLEATGQVFKPAAPLPQARGLRANSRAVPVRNYLQLSPAEKKKLSPDDLRQIALDSFNNQ